MKNGGEVCSAAGTSNNTGQNISVINYNNPTIKIKQEFASPFAQLSMGGLVESSNASSMVGGQMLRKSYDEEHEFQNKLNFAKHKAQSKKKNAAMKMGSVGTEIPIKRHLESGVY